MNRNVESHFAELPYIDIERSTFDRSFGHKTSFNVGQLIPFMVDEVLPGDTFNVSTSIVARLQTLLTPVMDNIYVDTYYFFVPNRIVWEHWKQFMGESNKAWLPDVSYSVPMISAPVVKDANDQTIGQHWVIGTIADYMGIPCTDWTGTETMAFKINALPFRGYAMICDQFFRDQNVMDPLVIPVDDLDVTGVNTDTYTTDVAKGGAPFIVSKYHDYFTSALPSPMKAPNFSIFSLSTDAKAPVATGASLAQTNGLFKDGIPLKGYITGDPMSDPWSGTYSRVTGALNSGTTYTPRFQAAAVDTVKTDGFLPCNLWANLDQAMLTINELRLAFQLQKFYERNARSGSRYRELLKAHFGVTSPDARMMIPEYLGGHRFPLAIHQIANQSQGESDFLGDLGALSNTSDVHSDFVKSFTEHGFVIGVMCARYDHSYSQGVERFWRRKKMLDYYFPVFANIGEQPIKNSEIYAYDTSNYDNVFGYQEAWADYRYKPSRVSGEMRPDITNTLASWHLGDDYDQLPTLSAGWMFEDHTNVDRVLAVTSQNSNQIFCDIYVKNTCTRPMPMYSIPGLIDHH